MQAMQLWRSVCECAICEYVGIGSSMQEDVGKCVFVVCLCFSAVLMTSSSLTHTHTENSQ